MVAQFLCYISVPRAASLALLRERDDFRKGIEFIILLTCSLHTIVLEVMDDKVSN